MNFARRRNDLILILVVFQIFKNIERHTITVGLNPVRLNLSYLKLYSDSTFDILLAWAVARFSCLKRCALSLRFLKGHNILLDILFFLDGISYVSLRSQDRDLNSRQRRRVSQHQCYKQMYQPLS